MNKINIVDIKNLKLTEKSKIMIVGTSGSGKSTLAEFLSKRYHIKNIELDQIYWMENWKLINLELFKEKILNVIQSDNGFVIHGNYNRVRDITWNACDTIIWLNYNRFLVMKRIFCRTLKRVIKKEVLWGRNIETIKQSFFSKNSIILFAWKTYLERKKQYSLLTKIDYGFSRVIIVKTPYEVNNFKKLLITNASS